MDIFAAFNWADYAIIGIVGISALISLFRGFVREVLSLLVWIGAFVLAWLYYKDLTPHLVDLVKTSESIRQAAAFGILFFAVLIVGGILTYLVGTFIDATGLSGTDRTVGMLFGALRGVLLVSLMLLVAGFTPMPKDAWWQESRLIHYFQPISSWLQTLLPPGIAEKISSTSNELLLPKAADKPAENQEQAPTGQAAEGAVESPLPEGAENGQQPSGRVPQQNEAEDPDPLPLVPQQRY